MADDFLGRKMEDHMSRPRMATTLRRPAATLRALLARNQECYDYDPSFTVGGDRLARIVASGEAAAPESGFVFRTVSSDEEAAEVRAALRDGIFATPPSAFVVVCSDEVESRSLHICLGAVLQSMLLQATEIGLNGMHTENFDRAALAAVSGPECRPLSVLAVGRSAERAANASIR